MSEAFLTEDWSTPPMAKSRNDRTVQWLLDNMGHSDKEACLIWPFARTRGYGRFGHQGKRCFAHRYMCELIHGAPPSSVHQAAHSCGKGHLGCVNPHHLSWKTPSENQLDCRSHGTQARTRHGSIGILTTEQAAQIRLLKGVKRQREVAKEYGVSEATISDIWLRRTHTKASKKRKWTTDDDAKLRAAIKSGMFHKDVAKILGRTITATANRASRLGLESKVGESVIASIAANARWHLSLREESERA